MRGGWQVALGEHDISPEEFRGRKAIGQEARRRIEDALLETLGKPLRPFAHDVPPIRYEAGTAKQAIDETAG